MAPNQAFARERSDTVGLHFGTYKITPAALAEEVVLYGALALASSISQATPGES